MTDADLTERLERLSRWLREDDGAATDEDVAWLQEHREYLAPREVTDADFG